MPDMIPDRVALVFFSFALALFLWIGFDTRRALQVLFFGQRAAKSLPDGRLRLLKFLTRTNALLIGVILIRHLLR